MTTINSSTLIHLSEHYYRFQLIKKVLDKISIPYLLLIGFIGLITNTSTIVLLSRHFITKNLKNKWTLIALALSDLLFNITLLIRTFNDIFKGNSDRLCMILAFFSHLAEILSAFYTVSFTIQRYTAVRYPLQVVLNRRSSPIISLLIILITSSIFSFILVYGNSYQDCHEQLELRWFIADGIISFFIPFLLIIIFNILIVNFIRKHSRSPLTIQSTLLRRKQKHLKTNYKNDETCVSENNTMSNLMSSIAHCDDCEHMELKSKRNTEILTEKLEKQTSQSSGQQSLHRMNSDASINSKLSRTRTSSVIYSKFFAQALRQPSHDSFIYRLNGRSSFQFNQHQSSRSLVTRTSQSIRVTRMLVLVSTCFLLLNAPAHFCVIATKIYIGPDSISIPFDHFKNELSYSIQNTTSLTYKIPLSTNITIPLPNDTLVEDPLIVHILYLVVFFTQLIAYASYSINFFLYSFSGIAFRTTIQQLFSKLRRH